MLACIPVPLHQIEFACEITDDFFERFSDYAARNPSRILLGKKALPGRDDPKPVRRGSLKDVHDIAPASPIAGMERRGRRISLKDDPDIAPASPIAGLERRGSRTSWTSSGSTRNMLLLGNSAPERPAGFSPEAQYNFNLSAESYAFAVFTHPTGFNSGKVFCFASDSRETCSSWIAYINESVPLEVKRVQEANRLKRVRERVKNFVGSDPCQLFIVIIICTSFGIVIAETQMSEQVIKQNQVTLNIIEFVIILIFTMELVLNVISGIELGGWLYFDAIIVGGCWLEYATKSIPAMKHLRILRGLRIMRALGRFKTLRTLIGAITSSILPVCQASLILFTVIAVYSTIGVELFRDKSEDFVDFVHAFHILFAFIALGEWDKDVLWPFDPKTGEPDGVILVYTYSYVCIVILVWT